MKMYLFNRKIIQNTSKFVMVYYFFYDRCYLFYDLFKDRSLCKFFPRGPGKERKFCLSDDCLHIL